MAECHECGEDECEHGESCTECRFWRVESDGQKGLCFRHAPRPAFPTPKTLTNPDSIRSYVTWPATWHNDWCGEFVLRVKP